MFNVDFNIVLPYYKTDMIAAKKFKNYTNI